MSKLKKIKECNICVSHETTEDFKKYINNRLKRGVKISEVAQDFIDKNYSVPTNHYLKNHKNNCLKNFVVIEDIDIEKPVETKKENIVEQIDLFKLPEFQKHQSKSFLVKRKLYQDILHFMFIKCLTSTAVKNNFTKEDLANLKLISELLKDSYTNLLHNSFIDVSEIKKIDIESVEDIERLTFELTEKMLDNDFLSESTTISILKILNKDISEFETLQKKENVEHSPEEKEKIAMAFMAFNNAANK